MTIDSNAFRRALGCYPTGVAVVTTLGPDGARLAMTANSFTSVSLEPPLVSFCLDRASVWFEAFQAATHFAVNVLREGQQELSERFATPLAEKWDGIAFEIWDFGCPILTDALANFECRTRYTYDGGDHVIFVGEIERMRADLDGQPLLFYAGRYQSLEREKA